MDARQRGFVFVSTACLAFSLAATALTNATPVGDTLTVIQRPLLNIPAIVAPGNSITIECEAAPGASGWTAELIRGQTSVPMQVIDSEYDPSTRWWEIRAVAPAIPLYELYDLAVKADGGIDDTTRNAVRIIPRFKNDYYFVHITDTHLPTHRYYYQSGADTDSSEVVDLREVIRDVNIINPEFVLLTGDMVNEGELEDFLGRRYFSRSQRLLEEFQVPVYLTSGNHDIGGWGSTPPPDGTARQTWWRFFGWKRLADPPPGAPWYTQDYSFNYGPVHYTGLEAYVNYDGWRWDIYGGESFTSGQMEWLREDLAASSASAAHVLFYHSDFSDQINLSSLGVDMALSGHTHSDRNDFTHPFDIVTAGACDGERSYRLVRVSGGVLEPSPTISAGSGGSNLSVEFVPANDGTHYSLAASVRNYLSERFEHSQLRFLLPNEPGRVEISGGTLLQVDRSGPYAVCYVGVDIFAASSQTVTATLDTSDAEAPTVAVASPNGNEVWDVGAAHDIIWTAADDVGVASVSIVVSLDGGLSYVDTLARDEANDGAYTWTPAGAASAARVKVIAYDGAGNSGEDASDGDFEIRQGAAGIPSHLVIEDTRPNPFDQHATIRFGVPRDGLVEIDLYDVSGHLVANVVAREYRAGYHSFDWDNKGMIGAGVYFIRLRLGSDTATRKAVIPR